jgi:hypothetical protein
MFSFPVSISSLVENAFKSLLLVLAVPCVLALYLRPESVLNKIHHIEKVLINRTGTVYARLASCLVMIDMRVTSLRPELVFTHSTIARHTSVRR